MNILDGDNFPDFEIQPGRSQSVEVFVPGTDCWLSFEDKDIVRFLNTIWELNWSLDDLLTAIELFEAQREN